MHLSCLLRHEVHIVSKHDSCGWNGILWSARRCGAVIRVQNGYDLAWSVVKKLFLGKAYAKLIDSMRAIDHLHS